MNATIPTAELDRWAEALARAGADAEPLGPPSEALPGLDVAGAYAIQQRGVEARLRAGASVVGRKIGLTSVAVQQQLGVSEPDFGALLSGMEAIDGASLDRGRLIAPRVEVEVAFVLGRALEGPFVDEAAVTAATDHVRAAIEVVDSRIADWRITLEDTVADNASSAAFVLGTVPQPLDALDVADLEAVLHRNGEEVERGNTSLVLGDPRTAVAWLANKLASFELRLEAGDIVLSGACTRMVDAAPGDSFRAELGVLGELTIDFGGAR
ncbi:MAG TPA: fumarylacetoacetate hydrolase family protein [Solirubrobacterales bacterium]